VHCGASFVGSARKGVAIISAFQCDDTVCVIGVVTMEVQAIIRGQTCGVHIVGICSIVMEVSYKYDQVIYYYANLYNVLHE
jgi:hypothetical protein